MWSLNVTNTYNLLWVNTWCHNTGHQGEFCVKASYTSLYENYPPCMVTYVASRCVYTYIHTYNYKLFLYTWNHGNLYSNGTWSWYFPSSGVLNARNFLPINSNDFRGHLSQRGGIGPGPRWLPLFECICNNSEQSRLMISCFFDLLTPTTTYILFLPIFKFI